MKSIFFSKMKKSGIIGDVVDLVLLGAIAVGGFFVYTHWDTISGYVSGMFKNTPGTEYKEIYQKLEASPVKNVIPTISDDGKVVLKEKNTVVEVEKIPEIVEEVKNTKDDEIDKKIQEIEEKIAEIESKPEKTVEDFEQIGKLDVEKKLLEMKKYGKIDLNRFKVLKFYKVKNKDDDFFFLVRDLSDGNYYLINSYGAQYYVEPDEKGRVKFVFGHKIYFFGKDVGEVISFESGGNMDRYELSGVIPSLLEEFELNWEVENAYIVNTPAKYTQDIQLKDKTVEFHFSKAEEDGFLIFNKDVEGEVIRGIPKTDIILDGRNFEEIIVVDSYNIKERKPFEFGTVKYIYKGNKPLEIEVEIQNPLKANETVTKKEQTWIDIVLSVVFPPYLLIQKSFDFVLDSEGTKKYTITLKKGDFIVVQGEQIKENQIPDTFYLRMFYMRGYNEPQNKYIEFRSDYISNIVCYGGIKDPECYGTEK